MTVDKEWMDEPDRLKWVQNLPRKEEVS